ncbi:hypothetical protein D3C80_2085590 [compost metagenome]
MRIYAGIDGQTDFLADAATEDEGHGSLPCVGVLLWLPAEGFAGDPIRVAVKSAVATLLQVELRLLA